MSLSGSADEIHTAATHQSVGTGGLTENVTELQATERRRIVGMTISKGEAAGRYEVSFSSSETVASIGEDNTKSGVLLATNTADTNMVVEDLDSEWAEGEELHVHATNNSGSENRLTLVVHYREM